MNHFSVSISTNTEHMINVNLNISLLDVSLSFTSRKPFNHSMLKMADASALSAVGKRHRYWKYELCRLIPVKDTGIKRFKAPPPCAFLITDLCSQIHLEKELK